MGAERVIAYLVLAAGLAGCTQEPSATRWALAFDPPELRADALSVRARVLRGGCDAPTGVLYEAIVSDAAPAPPVLGPGAYGLEAIATGAECNVVARDCREVEFPTTEDVVVLTLRGPPEGPLCPTDRCRSGVCEVPDAGPVDGGGGCVAESCNGSDDDCDTRVDEGFDLETDPGHCGTCERTCNFPYSEPTCVSGTCGFGTCSAGRGDCNGDLDDGCERDLTSANDCGACSLRCRGTMPLCGRTASGSLGCVRECGPDETRCGSACVDPQTNLAHCGTCDRTCTLPGASRTECTAGACILVSCATGFADCDDDPTNGCEVEIGESARNCGRCGTVCPSMGCESGMCAPPESCAEILAFDAALRTGSYAIDPDGSGDGSPFLAFCDMTTAGGGWTLVFEATELNYDTASLGYTFDDATLRNAASEVLIAHRDGARAVLEIPGGTWARFAIPESWKAASPFTLLMNDEPVAGSVVHGDGSTAEGAWLRSGYATWAGTGCGDFTWDTTGSWGTVCVAGSRAPMFGGFSSSDDDYCGDSEADWTLCSDARRFTLAVR